MAKSQIQCPNCKQPIVADVEQLFDVSVDPSAKERLLGGQINVVNCPHCGYQGSLATPLVYHDVSKEYLLTFFPQELNVSRDEQEKTIGPLIQKVVDALPQEERKGYLFKPQQMFTYQTLLEKVLEGEGVTKEMIESQKKRMDLLQRLITLSEDALEETIKQEEALVDAEFFSLFTRILEGSLASGDESSVQKLADLQEALITHSSYGRELKSQSEEIEAARKALTDMGEEITREKVLDLLIESAEKENTVNAIASMVRPALDYEFFQQLTNKIDASEGKEKEKLDGMRANLLEITARIDKELEARLQAAQTNLEALLQAENRIDLIKQNPRVIDDFFMQVINQNMQQAIQDEDAEKQGKLQALLEEIQSLLTPGYNPELLQKLVEAGDDDERNKILMENEAEITPEFVESLSGMMMQLQESEDQPLAEKVRAAYRATLKISMKKGMAAE